MVRPAFTLIEILVVIVIMGVVSSLVIQSGFATQRQAVFEANFQEVVLAMQDVRSKALANADSSIKGYGFEMNVADQTVTTFIDTNGDGMYNDGDEELKMVDLSDNPLFGVKVTGYTVQEDIADFTEDMTAFSLSPGGFQIRGNKAAVTFPSNKLTCRMAIYRTKPTFLGYMEATFGDIENEEESRHSRMLNVHHQSCIPEVSRESLLNPNL